MKLTPYQKRHLEALAYIRSQKPGVWSVLMFRPLSWLPFLALAGVSSLSCYYLDARWGMFMLGLTIGAVLRIISYARFTLMAWPITDEVTDWAKVEALRGEKQDA